MRRALYARQRVQVFKPIIDTRTDKNALRSHSGMGHEEAVAVASSAELLQAVLPETNTVGIEEVQFFDEGIINVCETLADAGYQVVAAGLDQDFRGCPFGPMPALLALADDIVKLRAICAKCGRDASRSQRLVNGRPSPASAPTVVIGAEEQYEARCRHCHEVR